jgi:hypothetical protein
MIVPSNSSPPAGPDYSDRDRVAEAEAAFLDANPAFEETAIVDQLRAFDYGRLDACGDVYLDYTGLATNFADVHRFIEFGKEFLDLGSVPDNLPPRLAC